MRSRTGRLAKYLYCALTTTSDIITSKEIGERTMVNATQVRRDLSQALGKIGKRGTGYKPSVLVEVLTTQLREDRQGIIDATALAQLEAIQLKYVLDKIGDRW